MGKAPILIFMGKSGYLQTRVHTQPPEIGDSVDTAQVHIDDCPIMAPFL